MVLPVEGRMSRLKIQWVVLEPRWVVQSFLESCSRGTKRLRFWLVRERSGLPPSEPHTSDLPTAGWHWVKVST